MRSSVSSLALNSEESVISLSGMSQDLPRQQQRTYEVDFGPEPTNFNQMDIHIQNQRNTFDMEPGIDATSAEPPPSLQRQGINGIHLSGELNLSHTEGLSLQQAGGLQPISTNPVDMNPVYSSFSQSRMEPYPGSASFSQRSGVINPFQTFESDRHSTSAAMQMMQSAQFPHQSLTLEMQQPRYQIDSAIPIQHEQTFQFARNESQGVVVSSSSAVRRDRGSNLMPQPTISRSSSGGRRSEPRQTSDKRRGKDRVVKLCSKCKEKNHIRRNQCTRCNFDMARRRPLNSSRAQRSRAVGAPSSNAANQVQNDFQSVSPVSNSISDSKFISTQNPSSELNGEQFDHRAQSAGLVQARQLDEIRNQRNEVDNNNQDFPNVDGSYLDIGHGGID